MAESSISTLPRAWSRDTAPNEPWLLATDDVMAEDQFLTIRQVETVTRQGSTFSIRGRGADLVAEVIHCLADNRMRVTEFRTVMPTLEDVFLKLTGHSIRD